MQSFYFILFIFVKNFSFPKQAKDLEHNIDRLNGLIVLLIPQNYTCKELHEVNFGQAISFGT